MPPPLRDTSRTSSELAAKVQAVLDSRQLTLYRVSRRSAELYGRSSPYFLPHNFYYDLRTELFRPSIYQIAALSHISGYRIPDWLRVFGFDLEDILRLQVMLPSKRTVVLDTSLTDCNDWVPWFAARSNETSLPAIAPLTMLLKQAPARQIASIQDSSARRFLYVKIGREDALAFPDLAPGSIVRVNPNSVEDLLNRRNAPAPDCFFLVEHSNGFFCCRIRILGNGVIVPVDNGLGHAQVELHCPQEARLRGTADLEFRPLLRAAEPEVPRDLARRWKPHFLPAHENFGQLLRRARRSMNLSVRDAARMSRMVAEILNDDRYTTSPSSLNDYELCSTAPRDFHKLITLSSIYGLSFESVLNRIGVDVSRAGSESMPGRYLSSTEPPMAVSAADPDAARTGFLGKLLEQSWEIPFFLRHSLGYFSSSGHVSIDDFFWVGGDDDPLHPFLVKGVVVLVNRRRKRPTYFLSKPMWQQPVYLVLKRNGKYLAACCGLEDRSLVVHPHARDFHRVMEYRNHQDVEVAGQIVAIARQLP